MRLILDQVKGQVCLDDLLSIPSPSQLDDWLLYNKVMGDDIRLREGDIVYSQWKLAEEQEEQARVEWHRREADHDKFLRELGRFGR